MAPKSKPKKKKTKTTTSRAKSARAKTARPAKRAATPSSGGGADETSDVLRASAKSFAARLLR